MIFKTTGTSSGVLGYAAPKTATMGMEGSYALVYQGVSGCRDARARACNYILRVMKLILTTIMVRSRMFSDKVD